jgi:ADP-heptose:LPS heptosyltransferase
MVLTRPFLVELRRFFPQAEITLSLSSNYQRGAPADLVDRIHVVYGSDRKDVSLRAQLRRARELGPQDILFDQAATSRALWLCRLTPAKLKVGFPYRALQRVMLYDVTVPRSDLRFEAETLLDMLSVLGHGSAYPPAFAVPRNPVRRATPYIVYFPSASTADKCWPRPRFAELIGRMAQQYPRHEHIVLQGIAEWENTDDILRSLQGRENVTGMQAADVDDTVSLLQGAALLVANDTGIRNLAIACDTPTVGIFFKTEMFRYWPRYGRHAAAFVPDGDYPAVEQVFALAVKTLESCE